MSYSSTNPPYAFASCGLQGSMWRYVSSDNSSDIVTIPGATANSSAYFLSCGYGENRATGSAVGMKVGETVLIVGSSIANIPFEATWMTVIASTANVLSTQSASGWNCGLDISVGGFTSTLAASL